MPINTALSIAGSDSSAGAGIQADLLTFASMGIYGTTAITCITAQNPSSVTDCVAVDTSLVSLQIKQVSDYYNIKAAKTGLLLNEEIIKCVAQFLEAHPDIPCVVDPVMISTSGKNFLNPDAIETYKKSLFPRAALITPNLDEAEVLLGERPSDVESMREAALELAKTYNASVLLKGGHLDSDTLTDVLASEDGEIEILEIERVNSINSHGSGCTLSAAITAALSNGHTLINAVHTAHAYIKNSFNNPITFENEKFLSHSL